MTRPHASRTLIQWLLTALLAMGGCQQPPPPAPPKKPSPVKAASTPTPRTSPLATPILESALPPAPPPVVPPILGTPTPAPTLSSAFLGGSVTAPASIISNNGGGVVAFNCSGIIGRHGAGLIANNGGSIIGNNGGNIIGNNSGAYRVLAVTGPEAALTNAYMYLTNRDEKFFIHQEARQVFNATTDGQGAYRFEITPVNGFPVGKDVVVNALLNDQQRMSGYLVPTQGENRLTLSLATTLATELLRGEAYRVGKPMSDYAFSTFTEIVSLTQEAIASGDIQAVQSVVMPDGKPLQVGTFDLQISHLHHLRNQYIAALSAVPADKSLLKRISDKWKELIGYRLSTVATVIGNGQFPETRTDSTTELRVEGDHRDGQAPPLLGIPVGICTAVAVSKRGDIFLACRTNRLNSSHIRWIRPTGKVTSLWNYSFPDFAPLGMTVERQPNDDVTNAPGTLLVADTNNDRVLRIPIVDELVRGADGLPKWPVEVVAGQARVTVADQTVHPASVDGDVPLDAERPERSKWRLAEEGERRYTSNGQLVQGPARFARLNGPTDVEVDEQGNIYICDSFNHRVRMIPKADGQYFGYRTPQDTNADGVVDGFGSQATLKAGCLYTIAGYPRWDATKAELYGHWFGEYADSDGGPGQQAKLDRPFGLAFRDGYLYLSDSENMRVRRISRATGIIELFAGKPPGGQVAVGQNNLYPPATGGDGGPARDAQFSSPLGLSFDAAGRLFVREAFAIRRIDANGTITTLAGKYKTANPGSEPPRSVSDGEALYWSQVEVGVDPAGPDIAVDLDGNVLLADAGRRRLRKVWQPWE